MDRDLVGLERLRNDKLTLASFILFRSTNGVFKVDFLPLPENAHK